MRGRLLGLLGACLCALSLAAGAANWLGIVQAANLHFAYQAVANFAHYANGVLYPGGSFSNAYSSATSAPTVTGGVLNSTTLSDYEAAYWNANTFGNDQWAGLKIGALTTSNDNVGIVLRSTSGNNFYTCAVSGPTGASATYAISKFVSGTFSFVTGPTTSPVSINVGDTILCRVTGTSIEMDYFPAAGGNGTGLALVTDSSLTSGSPGIYVEAASGSLTAAGVSEWYGGSVQ